MLNGDNKLNIFQKIIWLVLNYFSNLTLFIKPGNYWSSLTLNPNEVNEQLNKTYATSSPSRRLCDIFWNTLPWIEIEKVLGNKICALEIGCGKGGYGLRLNKLINDLDYLGCDLFPKSEWKDRTSKNISFKQLNSTDVKNELRNRNFIFTQSAVEHFKYDKLFFSDIQQHIDQTSKPCLQIHLVPSPSCLWKYLWHGYRQYSSKNISSIKKTTWSKSKFIAVKLGGKACNRLHLKHITFPMVTKQNSIREINEKKYDQLTRDAIRNDLKETNPKNSSFYALLIFSNISIPKNLKFSNIE